MNNEALKECDQITLQLENIIRVGCIYGNDNSFYEEELNKWNKKRTDLLNQRRGSVPNEN